MTKWEIAIAGLIIILIIVCPLLAVRSQQWNTALTISAIILGPILAVQVQKMVERLTHKREEKRRVFLTLLTTKGRRMAPEHVQALNAIHFFFQGGGRKDKEVIDAWDMYRDHLYNGLQEPHREADGKITEAELGRFNAAVTQWTDKGDEYLCDLLKKMADSLGYDYPDLQLKRGTYTPRGYDEMDLNQKAILNGLAEVLRGQRSLPMFVTGWPTDEEAQKAMLVFLKGEQSLPVRIEGLPANLIELKATAKRANP